MTTQEVASWLRETEAMLNLLLEQDNQVAEFRAAKAISTKLDNKKNLVAVENNLGILERQANQLQDLLRERTRAATVQGAVDLVTDMRAKLERAQNLYKEWRTSIAGFEFLDTLGRFAPEPIEGRFTRDQAEAVVERGQMEFEVQLDLAAKMIPKPGSIILLGAAS